METLLRATHYLPILTTLIAAVFTVEILRRWTARREARHLLWWGIGVGVYGVGTLTEALITLFGWSVALFKTWYVAGALLGGAPLALGTVYLLWGRRAGNLAAAALATVVAVTGGFVVLSPIQWELVDPLVPNSRVLGWQSIRLVSPFINGAAAAILIGGAIWSAMRYFRTHELRHRAVGNVFIAVGALLPGVGGAMSRAGRTEALYVGELIGILLIWYGYRYCRRTGEPVRPGGKAPEKNTTFLKKMTFG